MTDPAAVADTCLKGEVGLRRIDQDQFDSRIVEEYMEIRDRFASVSMSASGQYSAGLRIFDNRQHPPRIGRQPRQSPRGRRLPNRIATMAEESTTTMPRAFAGDYTSSPAAASHSSRLTGRVS